MSRLDVRDLKNEKLPAGRFPGDAPADFRLHLAPQVHSGMLAHAKKDITVEICGVLVGRWETDAHGPYALVTDYIACESASSKFAEVTFTHESWSQINKEMDTRFAEKRIVGWYHSHPDFGIFLSERDCFIHEHFFSGAGQVAYVIDPVRDEEGAFAWHIGKPELLSHFWIGDKIRSVGAGGQPSRASSTDAAGSSGQAGAAAFNGQPIEKSYLGLLTTVLAWLCLFLLGYLWAGFQSRSQRQQIAEGMIANFIEFKLMREGWEKDLTAVRQQMASITDELKKLPEITGDTPADKAAEIKARQTKLLGYLDACGEALVTIEHKFGFSEEERAALSRLIARKLSALREPPPPPKTEAAKDPKTESGKEAAIKNEKVNPRPAEPTPLQPSIAQPATPAETKTKPKEEKSSSNQER